MMCNIHALVRKRRLQVVRNMEDNDLSIIIKKANYVNSFYSNIIENISYLPSSISIFSYALMHM